MDTKYLEIIKAPIITEKTEIARQNGIYTFKVDPRANKTVIKLAIEKIFSVNVTSIKTMNAKPKKKRVGRYSGMTNHYKKAVVTLKEGQTIELGLGGE